MLLSLTDAAAANGMAPTTLRGYCQQGRVDGAVKVAGVWLLPPGARILPPTRPHGRPPKRTD